MSELLEAGSWKLRAESWKLSPFDYRTSRVTERPPVVFPVISGLQAAEPLEGGTRRER
jgi:hypothetical protein